MFIDIDADIDGFEFVGVLSAEIGDGLVVFFEWLTCPLGCEVEAYYFGVSEGFAKVDGDSECVDEAKTTEKRVGVLVLLGWRETLVVFAGLHSGFEDRAGWGGVGWVARCAGSAEVRARLSG